MTQKNIAIAGLLLTVVGAAAAAASAHADLGARVTGNSRRLSQVERAVDGIEWNISLLCERSGAAGCRSPQ